MCRERLYKTSAGCRNEEGGSRTCAPRAPQEVAAHHGSERKDEWGDACTGREGGTPLRRHADTTCGAAVVDCTFFARLMLIESVAPDPLESGSAWILLKKFCNPARS